MNEIITGVSKNVCFEDFGKREEMKPQQQQQQQNKYQHCTVYYYLPCIRIKLLSKLHELMR
jgi:hypothetical protein